MKNNFLVQPAWIEKIHVVHSKEYGIALALKLQSIEQPVAVLLNEGAIKALRKHLSDAELMLKENMGNA